MSTGSPRSKAAAAFLEAAGRAAARLARLDDLEQRLAGLCRAAREAWPELAVTEPELARHLGEKLERATDPERALSLASAPGLYLALACAQGDPAALAIFERELVPVARRAARRVRGDAAFADEVVQAVRERLLLPGDQRPARISDYSGLGPLDSWVRSVAVREALRQRGKARPAVTLTEALVDRALPARGDSRELVGAEDRKAFKVAFQRALAALSPQLRNVLRLHVVEGLSLAEIGAMYHAHKSTLSKQITEAKRELLQRTRDDLRRSLGVARGEVDTLMRQLEGEVDVSIQRMLRGE